MTESPEHEKGSSGCIDTEELQLMFQKSPSIVKCEQEKLSKREATLLVAIFLFITIAVTVGIIAGDVMKERDECLHHLENMTSQWNLANGDAFVRDLCLRDVCVHTASRMLKELDTSVKPCDDFYKYACGGWQSSNPVPPGKETWGVKQKVELEIRQKIRTTLEKPLDTNGEKRINSAVRKVTVFYQACLDTNKLDASGTSMIWDAITKIGGWYMQSGSLRSNWDITDSLSKMHFSYDSDALFYPVVNPNPYDRTKNIIQLAKTNLGIPSLGDYMQTSKPIVQKYKEYMKKIAHELGQSDPNRSNFAQQVFEMEQDLADILLKTQSSEEYEKCTVGELQSIANRINWIEYFSSGGFQVTRDTQILVASKEYFRQISNLILTSDKSQLNNYFVWNLAMGFAMDLRKEFREAALEYTMALTGTTSPQPRWEYCFNTAENWMSLAIGAVYVKRHFRNRTKLEVSWMVSDFQQAIKDKLAESQWIEEEDLVKINARIDSLVRKIAFPKLLESEAMLDAYYNYIVIDLWSQDSYTKILTSVMAGKARKMKELLKEPVDSEEWAIGLQLATAYYSAVTNELVLPAGTLASPYFDENELQFISYSGTGFFIGRELMRAFQRTRGDKNLSMLWQNQNYTEAYDKMESCVETSLAKRGIDATNPHKAQIMSEEMADLDGLDIAYKAYQIRSWRDGSDKVLPGMKKSADELFYLAYAQSMCESQKPGVKKQAGQGGATPTDLRYGLFKLRHDKGSDCRIKLSQVLRCLRVFLELSNEQRSKMYDVVMSPVT